MLNHLNNCFDLISWVSCCCHLCLTACGNWWSSSSQLWGTGRPHTLCTALWQYLYSLGICTHNAFHIGTVLPYGNMHILTVFYYLMIKYSAINYWIMNLTHLLLSIYFFPSWKMSWKYFFRWFLRSKIASLLPVKTSAEKGFKVASRKSCDKFKHC